MTVRTHSPSATHGYARMVYVHSTCICDSYSTWDQRNEYTFRRYGSI